MLSRVGADGAALSGYVDSRRLRLPRDDAVMEGLVRCQTAAATSTTARRHSGGTT